MCIRDRDTTAPYILEPWCVPISSKEMVDFDTHIFLGPMELVLRTQIFCFLFSIILFHTINRAHVLLSCNMYNALFLFLIYCVDQIINTIWVRGDLTFDKVLSDGCLDPLLVPLQGT